MTPPPLRLSDLTVAHGPRTAIAHVSGVFAPGSLTAVVGPNGAGKTTLLRAMAGLHAPSCGTIDRGGLTPGAIAVLPQASVLDRGFPITCLDVVALGHWSRTGPFRKVDAVALGRSRAALAAVGLAGLERRTIGALSAGQFQRVMFARLMVQDAPVLLLDEPFNAVDSRTSAELLALVRRWHAEGRTIVAVLHDLDLARRDFPDTLLLAREVVAWGPTSHVLRPEILARASLAVETWDLRASDQRRRPAA